MVGSRTRLWNIKGVERMLEYTRRHASRRFPNPSTFAADTEPCYLMHFIRESEVSPQRALASSSHLRSKNGVSSSFEAPPFPRLPSLLASSEFIRKG